MTKKISLSLATFALAVASGASSFKITLFQPSIVNGTELQPGDYKIELKNDKAVIKGRKTIETPVKTEAAESTFTSTSVKYLNGDGKYRVREIRIGGTNTKLVFEN
jgi:hypothetical protein